MEENHFDKSERKERDLFQQIYNNYLRHHRCHGLLTSPVGSKESYDIVFFSAATKTLYKTIICEYKRRRISIWKYPTSWLEKTKFQNLLPHHNGNAVVYYAVQYDDYTAFFNLSTILQNEQGIDDSRYVWRRATKNCASYSRGEGWKLFRELEFIEAEFFLTHDYRKLSYAEVTAEAKNAMQEFIFNFGLDF